MTLKEVFLIFQEELGKRLEAPLEKEVLFSIADQMRLFNEGDRSE